MDSHGLQLSYNAQGWPKKTADRVLEASPYSDNLDFIDFLGQNRDEVRAKFELVYLFF